jgi:hypothetical protein
MKKIAVLFLLGLTGTTAVAQSDLCWRDPYPWIPGEWAASGSVIDAGNRFQTVAGATVELWTSTYKYDDARQNALRHNALPATLVETALSDAHGAFTFKALQRNKEVQPASFEIRVHMPDRETGLAYTEVGTGLSPQWVGRGIKIALAQKGNGCSRIYSAGLDDTDCGVLDCEKLPAGPAKIVVADGTPLANARLDFYQHSKGRSKDPEFSLTTDGNGMITTPAQRGCFDIAIRPGGYMHLCFSGQAASEPITVVLPPKPNP